MLALHKRLHLWRMRVENRVISLVDTGGIGANVSRCHFISNENRAQIAIDGADVIIMG